MGTKTEENFELLENGNNAVKMALELFFTNNYETCYDVLKQAEKFFIKNKRCEDISIALSLSGLVGYMISKERYLSSLISLNDAKYLADSIASKDATLINEYCSGRIEFEEGNIKEAKIHYEKALGLTSFVDKYSLKPVIKEEIENLYAKKHTGLKRDPLVALLKIGQAVSAETDIDVLLKVIAEETKIAIQADRCSVFLYDKKNDELWSKVALGMDSQEIRFPANKGLAGHVVKTGETINIKDAYSDKRFNKEIDMQTGYKTKTILCMPIKNLNQEIIGAFQVLNKFDGEFNEEDENLLVAIGSSAGIALENAQLFKKQQEMFKEQKQVFDSFIDTLATSIDARDKITAGHSSRVRLYSGLIARELGLDDKYVEIVETAATLHDIGKIGIRDSVLQKEGKLTDEEYKHIQEHVEITHNILEKIHMSDDFKLVTEIACSHHEKYNGMGYYRKIAGENIPLGGRILAVSDVFDAITSKRHYRDKMPIENVINIMIKDSGSHFDSKIVDCFLSIPSDKIIRVFLTENNLTLDEKNETILKRHNLRDLYEILTGVRTPNKEEKYFAEIFQFYYMSKSKEDMQVNV